ncbi:MAG: NUDIX domain-containing protein, partial [Polyangiaceae bacterium]
SLPKGALEVVREIARHLLRRPVVGIVAACHTKDGKWLFIRRADTGTWCMPGGTLEWGETLVKGLARELDEEAGIDDFRFERIVGIYSKPERDIRFHAVTIVVSVEIDVPKRVPKNPLEVREARLFETSEAPLPLAMDFDDIWRDVLADKAPVLE